MVVRDKTYEEVIEEVILNDVSHSLVGWVMRTFDSGLVDAVSLTEDFVEYFKMKEEEWKEKS